MQVPKARGTKRFTDPVQLIEVGNEYIAREKYQLAAELFEALIADEPSLTHQAKAHNDCGIAYARLGEYRRAIASFEAAIGLSSYLIDSGARAYRNLAMVYKLLGDTGKAKENLEKAEVLEAEYYHYWVTNSDELE